MHLPFSQTSQFLTHLLLRSGLALTLGVAICYPYQAHAADVGDGKVMTENMKESCQGLMQMKIKMMEECKTQDAALTDDVEKMNGAPDDKKAGLIAAIVTKLVEQRRTMHVKMEKMQEKMMQHMMAHMQMGKDSMAQCPMMKSADGK